MQNPILQREASLGSLAIEVKITSHFSNCKVFLYFCAQYVSNFYIRNVSQCFVRYCLAYKKITYFKTLLLFFCLHVTKHVDLCSFFVFFWTYRDIAFETGIYISTALGYTPQKIAICYCVFIVLCKLCILVLFVPNAFIVQLRDVRDLFLPQIDIWI